MYLKDLLDKDLTKMEAYEAGILVEEILIGRIKSNKLKIMVNTEPLGNPSFHFGNGKDFEVVLQIKDLKVLETKYNKYKKFPSSYFRDLKEWLSKSSNIEKGKNNWQALLHTWNILNQSFKVSEKLPIPV